MAHVVLNVVRENKPQTIGSAKTITGLRTE